MTIRELSRPVQDSASKVEEAAVETSMTANGEDTEFALLLSQVRSELSRVGCADKIDAEGWLRTWLDTPNAAFHNVRPRSLLRQVRAAPGTT
jgi:hypothetical protein